MTAGLPNQGVGSGPPAGMVDLIDRLRRLATSTTRPCELEFGASPPKPGMPKGQDAKKLTGNELSDFSQL
jgi:hypothetical protein